MSKFQTLLIGVGIGLLIAPMPGSALRQQLRSRFQEFFNSAKENIETATYEIGQNTPSPTESAFKQTAEEAMNATTEGTLAAESPEPFTPSYPEYVNPENPSNP